MSTEDANVNVWFITGTSSGFGRRLVHSVLARGDRVIATARSLEKIQDFPKSTNLHLLQLDIECGVEAIKAVIDEAVKVWGRIDVLVNNAALAINGLMEEAGSEVVKRVFQSNVFSMLDVTTAVLPYMRARRSGTVVVMGSRTSWMPENPSGGIYAASKSAVRTVGETLSVELAPFSIRVLIVEPGAFRTEGIFSQPFYDNNPIPDYDDLRESAQGFYKSITGKQKGDPVKGMEALVDVVRGEGRAKGKKWPLYLPLGAAAENTIRDKCHKMLGVLDEWTEVIRDVNLDE